MPDDDIANVEALIGRAQEKETTLGKNAGDEIKLRVGQDRSKIVQYVFGAYCGTIAVIMIYLTYRGYNYQENVFSDFMEVLKIAIVPIVTLVIGYYFGTEKNG